MLAEAAGSSEGWLTRKPVDTCCVAVARACWLCCIWYCISGSMFVTRMLILLGAVIGRATACLLRRGGSHAHRHREHRLNGRDDSSSSLVGLSDR